MRSAPEFVLTLSCRGAKGIVFAVSRPLHQAGFNSVDRALLTLAVRWCGERRVPLDGRSTVVSRQAP